jgi:hypothetical protein
MEYSPREERLEIRLQSCWSPALVMLVSVMSTVRSEEQIGCNTCSQTRHSSFVNYLQTRHSSFLNHLLTRHSSAPAHVRGIHHFKIICNAAFIFCISFVNSSFLIFKFYTRHSSSFLKLFANAAFLIFENTKSPFLVFKLTPQHPSFLISYTGNRTHNPNFQINSAAFFISVIMYAAFNLFQINPAAFLISIIIYWHSLIFNHIRGIPHFAIYL